MDAGGRPSVELTEGETALTGGARPSRRGELIVLVCHFSPGEVSEIVLNFVPTRMRQLVNLGTNEAEALYNCPAFAAAETL